jgi:hypothetical protein
VVSAVLISQTTLASIVSIYFLAQVSQLTAYIVSEIAPIPGLSQQPLGFTLNLLFPILFPGEEKPFSQLLALSTKVVLENRIRIYRKKNSDIIRTIIEIVS